MADKDTNVPNKNDFISREAVLELIDNSPIIAGNENETLISAPKLSDEVYCLPVANVRPVVKASWKKDNSYPVPGLMNLRCSVCGGFGGTWKDNTLPSMLYNFCPNCGADMRPDENGQRGEKNSG